MSPKRTLIGDGAVAIVDDRIAAVGKASEIDAAWFSEDVIDAGGGLIAPGLIDGHNHPAQYLSRGLGDDVGIIECLYGRLYPYEAACSEEDAYIGALADFVEMVSSGTTCFVDPGGYHVNAMARAAVEVGLRGIFSRSTRDQYDSGHPVPGSLRETTTMAIERATDVVESLDGAFEGRLRAWFSLRVPYNVSDELCVEIRDLAEKYEVGIHSHVCAQEGENEASIERFGMRVLERLRRLDLLRPNLYLAHMGWVTDEEIDLLESNDVKVAHCPTASMHGAYGNISRKTIPKMVERGIAVSLGTDSVTAGRTLDMFRVMYLAACAHKDVMLDPTVMGAYQALEMATITGARAAMWDDEIGSLEVGKKADLIVVDTSSLAWHPLGDPIRTLVYSGSGQSVETVVVDGRVIMEGRAFPGIDLEQLRDQVETHSSAVLARANLSLASQWPQI